MKRARFFGVFLCIQLLGLAAAAAIELRETADRVELVTPTQKVVAEKGANGYLLGVQVKVGEEWKPFFDSGRPLVSGTSFDLHPASYKVEENTEDRKTLAFSGQHQNPEYPWEIRVEASSGAPWIKFTIVCHLSVPLTLQGLEPVVALWSRRPGVAVQLDQGPDSIYRSAGIPHGFGFPAAHFWDDGVEAFVFFDMTPMTWMSQQGVWRFHDVRIQTRSEGEHTGLGMHLKKLSGKTIAAGDMVVPFYLCVQARPEKPTKLQALATMIETFAPLHPATSPWPTTVQPGGELTWKYFAQSAIENLMREGETMATITAPWTDSPIELAEPQEKMIVHPARAVKTPEEAATSWDFSTVNNHLTPWILFARVNGNQDMYRVALAKANALPRFFDPKAGILRHGTRVPPHVGDMEMSWQNFFFHIEALRAAEALPQADFNPAIAGRVLMAVRGLREFAYNVDYVFPQWFDPYSKLPIVQNDMPKLGMVREPWQAGAFAHLMAKAREASWLGCGSDSPIIALDRLMLYTTYRESNEIYEANYSDPADFPITELFGNAYGSVAALEGNRDERPVRYARDMVNTILRLTFWYEDESDAVSRDVRNLGLFYPHCGAANACPWETVEANLCLAYHVKNDKKSPVRELLLKLLNLNRINSFYFFPATYSEQLRARDGRTGQQVDDFFPVEPFYTLEGQGGHKGPAAAYMASLAMWNYWMYEALAEVSPRDVMVLNLDTLSDYDTVLRGIERNFVLFNPTQEKITAQFRIGGLPTCMYWLEVQRKGQALSSKLLSYEELSWGVPIVLDPIESVDVSVKQPGYGGDREWRLGADRRVSAGDYAALQENAHRVSPELRERTGRGFRSSIVLFREGKSDDKSWIRDCRSALTAGTRVAWVSLFTNELITWRELEGDKYHRSKSDKTISAPTITRKVLDLPIHKQPSQESPKIGCIRVTFSLTEPQSLVFVPEGNQEPISFEPDEYEDDPGCTMCFHQSILEQRGDWVLLPRRPLPEPGWISLETPEGILWVERADGIYTFKGEGLVVIDTTENGLLVRPEQDSDMWCDSNPPPHEPFTPEERTFDQLRDADGHWLLEKKYKKGC